MIVLSVALGAESYQKHNRLKVKLVNFKHVKVASQYTSNLALIALSVVLGAESNQKHTD